MDGRIHSIFPHTYVLCISNLPRTTITLDRWKSRQSLILHTRIFLGGGRISGVPSFLPPPPPRPLFLVGALIFIAPSLPFCIFSAIFPLLDLNKIQKCAPSSFSTFLDPPLLRTKPLYKRPRTTNLAESLTFRYQNGSGKCLHLMISWWK